MRLSTSPVRSTSTLSAEGIEHEEQAERLIELGCRLGQGFHFARPMAAESLAGLLGGSAYARACHSLSQDLSLCAGTAGQTRPAACLWLRAIASTITAASSTAPVTMNLTDD